jgi:hypothetical protein
MIRIASLIIAMMLAVPARAAPPPGPIDPDVAAWFEGLVRADGIHCCGVGDCRIAGQHEVRTTSTGYEVLLNGSWTPVPDSIIVHRDKAPFAATIICKSHYDSAVIEERLYCVVPYAGG